jgi:putative transposase
MFRSFQYPLNPTRRQAQALDRLLALQSEAYNAALQERRDAWRHGVRVTKFEQFGQIKELWECRPDVMAYGVTVLRGTLTRLDRAFQAFFRRVRRGQRPGYPRFRSWRRFDTASYEDTSGWKLKPESRRLYVHGVGDIKINLHRPLRGVPKTLHVSRKGKKWYAAIQCADVPRQPLPATGRVVGCDLGVASLVTTSDGEHIANPRHFGHIAYRLARAQQGVARAEKWSARRRRRVEQSAALHRKAYRARKDHNHKVSRHLVDTYDLIAFEALNIPNMTRSAKGTIDAPGTKVAQKAGLNREIHSAGWAGLLSMVAYKAEDAGRHLEMVPARHTSQTCHSCGHRDAANRISQAEFRCQRCGVTRHADHNAAMNILRAGLAQRATRETEDARKTARLNSR